MRTIGSLLVVAWLAGHAAPAAARDYLRDADLTPAQAKRLASIADVTRRLPPTDYRKLLYARCDPVFLVVRIGGETDAKRIGLRKEDLFHAVEGRLRAARLFVESGYQSVSVRVTLSEPSVHVSVGLYRLVDNIGAGMDGVVRIWGTSKFGGYSRAGPIVEAVSRGTNEFIAKYLRANDGACQMRWAMK